MTESGDRLKAMRFQNPGSIPIAAWIPPATWAEHGRALDAIVAQHPRVFGQPGEASRVAAGTYVAGDHVDAWGCVWSNVHQGLEAIVTGHPVQTREAVRTLRLPEKDIGFPHGFMYLRLLDLRGFEEAMVDFAEEPPELRRLIDVVLEYNLRQARLRLAQLREPGSIVYFGDDLGMQNGLAIGAGKWRTYLKPCYERIYRPFREAGHHVYMHTDGCIHEIIPDLIECGVEVVNPQIGANGLDNLVRTCRGKVCVDIDLDRQKFPFWTPAQIDAHVREVVEALALPEGGLWLHAEIGPGIPLANIEAIAVALETHRGRFGRAA